MSTSRPGGAGTAERLGTLLDGLAVEKATRALFDAVQDGDVAGAEVALQDGARLDGEVQGRNVLTAAASAGQAGMLEWAIRQGLDPARRTRSGWNAAGVAAYADQAECLRVLLEAGVDPWDEALGDISTWCAASWAMTRGGPKLIRTLLSHLGDVNRRLRQGDNTLLILAAANAREDTVRQLLAAGADARPCNQHGKAAIDLVSGDDAGECAIVGMLIEAGALADAPRRGEELLCRACRKGWAGVARVYMQHGISPDAIDAEGRPAILAACDGSDEAGVRVIDALAAYGVQVDARRNGGQMTALMWASRSGLLKVAERLLAAGACVNAGLESGRPALAFAGTLEMAQMLLRTGADPHVTLAAGTRDGAMVADDVIQAAIDTWAAVSDRRVMLDRPAAKGARRRA